MTHRHPAAAPGANDTVYSPVPSDAMEAADSNGAAGPKAAAAALGTPQPQAPSTSTPDDGGRKLFQFLGAGAACLFAVCMGTTMGWTSAATRLQKPDSLNVTDSEYSWIGACMPLGAMLAAPPTSPAIARWGRRNMMLGLSPILFLAWLLIIFANAAWMVILARLVIGAAIGSISMIAPLYSNEIAHRSVRGTLGGFFQFLHTCGVLLAYVLDLTIPGDLTWISVICACVPLVAGVCFFFFPDTPAWYMEHGRKDEARAALVKFRGQDYPSERLDAELDEIYNEIKQAQDSKKTTLEAFSTGEAKLGLALSMNLMVVQQLSGVSAVIFYAGPIFKDAGSSLKSEEAAIVMGACLAGATLLSLFLVDKIGRRILLLLSGISVIICNVVLGIYLYFLDQNKKAGTLEEMEQYGIVPILTMSLFMILFSIGYGPIPWSYMTEVFTPDIRSKAMSVATVTNWAMVFIVTLAYDPLQKAVGGYTTFWIFGAIVLAGSLVVYFFLVETKGKTSSEIQEELRRKVGSRPPEAAGAV